jgi:hypothetical protein
MHALSLGVLVTVAGCAAVRADAQVAAPPPRVVGRPAFTVPAGHAAVYGPRYFLAVPDTIAGFVRTARRIDFPNRFEGTMLRYAAPDSLHADLFLYSLTADGRTCTTACAAAAARGEVSGFTMYSVYFVRMSGRERGTAFVSDTYIFAMDDFAAKVRATYAPTVADAGPRIEAFALAAAGGVRQVPFDAPLPLCRAGRWVGAPIQVSVMVEQPPDTLYALLQRAVADLGYTRSRVDSTSQRLVTVPRFAGLSVSPASGSPPWRTVLGQSGHTLLMFLHEAGAGGTQLNIVSRAVCNIAEGSAGQGTPLNAALDSAAREVLRRVVALAPIPGR